MRSVSTPRGMQRPQPQKTPGTFRPLERGLKRAALLRDGFQCVRHGKPQTTYPIHPYDFLDVLHFFVKSTWPLARF
jgi:hypothetical protein